MSDGLWRHSALHAGRISHAPPGFLSVKPRVVTEAFGRRTFYCNKALLKPRLMPLKPGDLFELGPKDLIAKEVHICICDAQYMRNEVAWDERLAKKRLS